METFHKAKMIHKGDEKEHIVVKAGVGFLGGLKAQWIQPVRDKNVFSSFLDVHGEGAMALIHRVESQEKLDKMIQDLGDRGVNIIGRFSLTTKYGITEYALMDTKTEGAYYLGFVLEGEENHPRSDGKNELDMTFNQYAFAVLDPVPVSDFWASLGFPILEITHGPMHDKMYDGKASEFDMKLGWQRHGSVVYEWCIPLKPPTIYADYIAKHGEGLQHFGFAVSDMDRAIQHFEDQGYRVSMSGGWGTKGKPGSGRFVYVDLEKIGGITIELLWSYHE